MENAIAAVLSVFPFQLVKIITCDRGTEFANWLQIEEQLHCEVYFAGPYCAWQKGAIENLNGLLADYNVTVTNGIVVEGDREIMIPAVPEFILETNIPEGYVKVRLIEGM